jgi:hypothetical protein
MPKNNDEIAHFFITQALTGENTNVSMYNNQQFKIALRLVAIDAIQAILQLIKRQHYGANRLENLAVVQGWINTPHPETKLNMLDYCLAAGFDTLALELIRYGATSNNLSAFQRNISREFSSEFIQSDILRDIKTIFDGCMEIKQQYDQLVNTTNTVVPSIKAACNRIFQHAGTKTWLFVGVGCAILAPVVAPVLHVHLAGTAALASAGFIPAAIGLIVTNTSGNAMPTIDASKLIKQLSITTKKLKNNLLVLQEQDETHNHKSDKKHYSYQRKASITLLSAYKQRSVSTDSLPGLQTLKVQKLARASSE